MGIYVGVNGTPKEITALYVGVNGVPKECTDVYVGVNGVPKSCYSGVKPGETVFTSSTNFTIPRGVKKIDCFCVGGGGGAWWRVAGVQSGFTSFSYQGAGGGGGGYTSTKLGADANPGQTLSVVVGSGNWAFKGSSSSIGSICSAEGGNAASADGGNGGSGGGGAGGWWDGEGGGGVDGGDGENSQLAYDGCRFFIRSGGTGQHTTTRYFGESNGTLYASGGSGSNFNKGNGSNGDGNTGNGGNASSGTGGSGICIIRWGKQ